MLLFVIYEHYLLFPIKRFVPKYDILLLQIKCKANTTTINQPLAKYFRQDQDLENIEVVPNLNKY